MRVKVIRTNGLSYAKFTTRQWLLLRKLGWRVGDEMLWEFEGSRLRLVNKTRQRLRQKLNINGES
jgi:hypothetical protein